MSTKHKPKAKSHAHQKPKSQPKPPHKAKAKPVKAEKPKAPEPIEKSKDPELSFDEDFVGESGAMPAEGTATEPKFEIGNSEQPEISDPSAQKQTSAEEVPPGGWRDPEPEKISDAEEAVSKLDHGESTVEQPKDVPVATEPESKHEYLPVAPMPKMAAVPVSDYQPATTGSQLEVIAQGLKRVLTAHFRRMDANEIKAYMKQHYPKMDVQVMGSTVTITDGLEVSSFEY